MISAHQRGQQPGPELPRLRILPPAPHAADEIEALFERRDELRDLFRIALQIGVHRDDVAAVRAVEAGGKRGVLAEVRRQLDDDDAFVALLDGAQRLQRVVGAAVVHVNELDAAGELGGRGANAAVEGFDHLAAGVVERHHDRDADVSGLHA